VDGHELEATPVSRYRTKATYSYGHVESKSATKLEPGSTPDKPRPQQGKDTGALRDRR
jgi:hypothetical protein